MFDILELLKPCKWRKKHVSGLKEIGSSDPMCHYFSLGLVTVPIGFPHSCLGRHRAEARAQEREGRLPEEDKRGKSRDTKHRTRKASK